MARENAKKHEKVILDNVPQENVLWLKQPHNLTFLRGELSMSQLNILVELVNQLQVKIEESLSCGQSLFKDEDYDPFQRVEVRVPLKSLTSNATKYNEIEEVATMLWRDLNVDRPCKTDDGADAIERVHVFHSVKIPRGEGQYRKSYIEFKIDRDMAESVFALNRYNQYIKSIAKNRKSAFASRIYMFITAFRKFGVWKPTYDELHKLLGFTVYEKDRWVVKKYPQYRHFKRKVLTVAQSELKELADNGQVDCYFDFTEEYPEGGKKADGPYKIIFTIHTTSLGKRFEDNAGFNHKRIEIEGIMRNDFGLKTSDIISLFKIIDADNADYLLVKMDELKRHLLSRQDEIKDIRKYSLKSIRSYLMDLVPLAEEVQPIVAPATPVPVFRQEFIDEKSIRDKWIKAVGMKNYKMFLVQAEIIVNDGKVSVKAPHPDVAVKIEEWKDLLGVDMVES